MQSTQGERLMTQRRVEVMRKTGLRMYFQLSRQDLLMAGWWWDLRESKESGCLYVVLGDVFINSEPQVNGVRLLEPEFGQHSGGTSVRFFLGHRLHLQ